MMKQRKMRILSFLLVLVMALPLVTSCAGVNKKAAVSFQGEEINCATFQYLCSLKKTSYLYEAYGVSEGSVSSSELQDNAAIWTAKAEDGSTVADTLKSEVLDEVKLFLYMAKYAKDQGFTLGDKEKKLVKQQFDKAVSNYGDKKSFNREMKRYGINYDQMLAYNYFQTLAYQGLELLFGENGSRRITDESVEKYFKDHYATTLCIFINTKDKTYPNGKVVGLPQDEKEAKLSLAESVYQKALAGEDFASLVTAYSDTGSDGETAANGYTFRQGGFVNSKAEEKVFQMKTGEIARVDTDGGVYILCRKALNTDFFDSAKQSIRTELEEVKKYALVSDVDKEFKVNTDFLNTLDIAAIPHVV